MISKQSRTDEYKHEFEEGMNHVIGHLQSDIESESRRLGFINTGEGNPDACMRALSSQALASALVAWFRDNDLTECKRWAFVSAKLQRIRQQKSDWLVFGNPLVSNLFGSWTWLISDCVELIDWRRRFEPFRGLSGEEPKPKEMTKSIYGDIYIGYQLTLALRGEWDRLGARAERWLANPPSSIQKVTPDMRFFLALAGGNIAEMEAQLREITTPRQRRWRGEWQHGYSYRLISDEAVVYAKLAWMHGYQVDVDTPYIPKEWLPIAPIANYEEPDHWEFSRTFDINQPLPT